VWGGNREGIEKSALEGLTAGRIIAQNRFIALDSAFANPPTPIASAYACPNRLEIRCLCFVCL
jgi:hypothetical protein